MNPLKTLFRHQELVKNLVSRELKSRYKGSVLGVLWSLLTPLFMAIISVCFFRLLARGMPAEEIIVGVFAWQFTVQSVQEGMRAITGNSNLVKKVFFPRILLPLSITLSNLVNYLLSLIVQFVFIFIWFLLKSEPLTLSIFTCALPFVIIYQTLFNIGMSLLVSASNVYYRDTQHAVGILMSAWFFMSPVMYNLSFIEPITQQNPWIMNLYMLNPIAGIITAYRALLFPDITFEWTLYTLLGFVWPLVLTSVSYFVFRRAQKNFSDML
ncbi:MAG: hypothetical protein GKR87_15715 [Kiritimatiellae bacterium]|nr:hypothetical protein [Kiritimatiellia bacterium]